MTIAHLAEHTTWIPTLALWAYHEWGHLFPDETYATLMAKFAERTTDHTIPETFVALEHTVLLGMASLVKHDLPTRTELSPWLADVYVAPEWRQRGVGSKLVQVAMQEAESLGVATLYLFTPDKLEFYRRLGWRVFETTRYRGEAVTIMAWNRLRTV